VLNFTFVIRIGLGLRIKISDSADPLFPEGSHRDIDDDPHVAALERTSTSQSGQIHCVRGGTSVQVSVGSREHMRRETDAIYPTAERGDIVETDVGGRERRVFQPVALLLLSCYPTVLRVLSYPVFFVLLYCVSPVWCRCAIARWWLALVQALTGFSRYSGLVFCPGWERVHKNAATTPEELKELQQSCVTVRSKDVTMLLTVKYQNTKKYIRLVSGFIFLDFIAQANSKSGSTHHANPSMAIAVQILRTNFNRQLGKSCRTVDSLRDLEAAVSSSSDRHTPSSSTVHHLKGLVLESTEWMVVGFG
ncbi:hypothetical protein INR49_018744, partial [Caranx melampygus]